MGIISKLRETLGWTSQEINKTSNGFSNVLHALAYIDKLSESNLPNRIVKTSVVQLDIRTIDEINEKYYLELFQENKELIFPVFFGIYESQTLIERLKLHNNDYSENINEDKTLNFSTVLFFNSNLELEDESSVFVPANSMILNNTNLLTLSDESSELEAKIYSAFSQFSPTLSFSKKLENMNNMIQRKFGLRGKSDYNLPFGPEKAVSLNDLTLLHSFYAKDLEKALSDPNDNVKQYILGSSKNIDIDQGSRWHQSAIRNVLSPQKFLEGRWPSKPEYALSTMQQFVVNYARNWDNPLNVSNSEGNINSQVRTVNGPPGSGKTTLLKDIFADLIVEQAMKMTAFEHPEDAFSKITSFKITEEDTYPTVDWKLDERVQGYGIVVASSNNAAVENITNTLPQKVEIFQDELSEIDYFKSIYCDVYEVDEKEIWGVSQHQVEKMKIQRILKKL